MDGPHPPPQLHYHIRWSGKTELDWEGFDTRANAEASAKYLVRPGETYIIEEHGQSCARCAALHSKTAHAAKPVPTLEYPWQKAVSDAFAETRSEVVPLKVNSAQRAISARLRDKNPVAPDEHIAIREALQSLGALFPEQNEPHKESQDKKATA